MPPSDLLVALPEGRFCAVERVGYASVRGRRRVCLQTPHPLKLAVYSLRVDAANLGLIQDCVVVLIPDFRVQPLDAGLGAGFAEWQGHAPDLRNRQGTKSRDCERVPRKEPPQLRRFDHPGCDLQRTGKGSHHVT